MTLRVFGLTGGIGSGKSRVATVLRARGLPVLDADRLARAAVERGSPALQQIVEHFGADLLKPDGALDRVRLGELVFSNAEARRALDAIVHPRVRELAGLRFRDFERSGEPLACYEVPLLYEVGLEQTYQPVVVVTAPLELRKLRLSARDGLNEAQIEARIAAQMPLEDKARRAAYVIDNSGSLAELSARSNAVFDALCGVLGVAQGRYPRSADQRQ